MTAVALQGLLISGCQRQTSSQRYILSQAENLVQREDRSGQRTV